MMHFFLILILLASFITFIKSHRDGRNFTIAAMANLASLDNSEVSIDNLVKIANKTLNKVEKNNVKPTNSKSEKTKTETKNEKTKITETKSTQNKPTVTASAKATDTTQNTTKVTTPTNTNPIYSVQTLPENATAWEMMKAQIYADFKPFLILIPNPIKRYIQYVALKLSDSIRYIFLGAVQSFFEPFLPLFALSGKIFIFIGDKLIHLAEIASSDDDTTHNEGTISQSSQQVKNQDTSKSDTTTTSKNTEDTKKNNGNKKTPTTTTTTTTKKDNSKISDNKIDSKKVNNEDKKKNVKNKKNEEKNRKKEEEKKRKEEEKKKKNMKNRQNDRNKSKKDEKEIDVKIYDTDDEVIIEI